MGSLDRRHDRRGGCGLRGGLRVSEANVVSEALLGTRRVVLTVVKWCSQWSSGTSIARGTHRGPFRKKILNPALPCDRYRYIVNLTTRIEKRSRDLEGVSQCTTKNGEIPEKVIAGTPERASGCAAVPDRGARAAAHPDASSDVPAMAFPGISPSFVMHCDTPSRSLDRLSILVVRSTIYR